MFTAFSCRICTFVIAEVAEETAFSVLFYRFRPYPLLGLLFGNFDRILGHIYSHSIIRQVKFFVLKTHLYFPAAVIQFFFCFFGFSFSLSF